MIIPTHILATNIGILLLNLPKDQILLAYIGGVLIDLDHILSYFYLKIKNNSRIKNLPLFAVLKNGEIKLHSFLHEPISLILIIIALLILKSKTLAFSWLLHIGIDQLILKSNKSPLYPFSCKVYCYGLVRSGSRFEWIVSTLLATVSTLILIIMYN